jgi:hypothetical protein
VHPCTRCTRCSLRGVVRGCPSERRRTPNSVCTLLLYTKYQVHRCTEDKCRSAKGNRCTREILSLGCTRVHRCTETSGLTPWTAPTCALILSFALEIAWFAPLAPPFSPTPQGILRAYGIGWGSIGGMSMRPSRTIAERIATIAARCHRRRLISPKARERNKPNAWRGRLERARLRREQLEEERPHWERLVSQTGSILEIAERMGCCTSTARAAIWDLGLWPELVRAGWRGRRVAWIDGSCRGGTTRDLGGAVQRTETRTIGNSQSRHSELDTGEDAGR